MHTSTAFTLLVAAGTLTQARPVPKSLLRRELPQEHSHNKFIATVRTSLATNNPDAISDPVFGLLGNAAAAAGQGKVSNTDCLQQATADQAFTNAKAANDIEGMTAALVYRALERNTGKVGLASVACTAITAVNPEIAAIAQHQDPASTGAAATNKAITLALAKQIASVGGDPQTALQSGTFAPGNLNDNTGAGNTCDDANDTQGCIFTQNLLVEDATADEITAAAGGAAAAGGQAANGGTAGDKADKGGKAGGKADKGGKAGGKASAATTEDAAATSSVDSASTADAAATDASSSDAITTASATDSASDASCASATTITVTASAADTAATDVASASVTDTSAASDTDSAAAAAPTEAAASAGGVTTVNGAANLKANVDLGTCPDIAIAFALGLDGRKETSFINANQEQFNHGSADAMKIIAQFSCDNLANKCGVKADSDGAKVCAQALAATSAGGKDGSTADLWNSFFGITTNFASVPVVDDQGRTVSPNGVAAAAATPVATAAKAPKAPKAPKASKAAAGKVGASAATAPLVNAAATGGNVNKFTGAVGAPPTPVLNIGGARPFKVVNDTFINSGAALQRGCDVQHNACSNAANSNKALGISASDCTAQNTKCQAANGI